MERVWEEGTEYILNSTQQYCITFESDHMHFLNMIFKNPIFCLLNINIIENGETHEILDSELYI